MSGVYTSVSALNDISAALHEDGYTCGTRLVESAATIVRLLKKGCSEEQLRRALDELRPVMQDLHRQHLAKRAERRRGGQ